MRLADGDPLNGPVVAVIDETTPQIGAGVYYVMTTAVLIEPAAISAGLGAFFSDTPGRSRPFHWSSEGPAARQRMTDLIIDAGVVAISRYQSTARTAQKQARGQLLVALADDLRAEQIDHLIIESGDKSTNRRDQQILLDHFRATGGVPFAYDWRSKNEPLLWIADAIGGAIHDYFKHDDAFWLQQLQAAGVLHDEPIYSY